MAEKYLNLKLPDDVHRRLKVLAVEHGQSITTEARDAIVQHLQMTEEEPRFVAPEQSLIEDKDQE